MGSCNLHGELLYESNHAGVWSGVGIWSGVPQNIVQLLNMHNTNVLGVGVGVGVFKYVL